MSSSPADRSTFGDDSREEQVNLLKLLDKGTLIFNNRPREGISFLISNGILSDRPADIARFLVTTPNLDKTVVGELLGKDNEFSLALLNSFAEQFDYRGTFIDEALRLFMARFAMPGESQMVYRILERFSEYYALSLESEKLRESLTRSESSSCKQLDKDKVHILAYAIVMLNTDAHSPSVKHKLGRAKFVETVRIATGGQLCDTEISGIFDRVTMKEFRPETTPSELMYSRLAKNPKFDQPILIDFATLNKGGIFVKYGRAGAPKKRLVFISDNCICWTESDRLAGKTSQKDRERKIHLDDVIALVIGTHGTPVFRRASSTIPPEAGNRCFSIITEKRSLDLQAPRAVNLKIWLQFFHTLLLAREERIRKQKIVNIPDNDNNSNKWERIILDWASHWNCGARVGAVNSISSSSLPPDELATNRIFSNSGFALDRGQRLETAVSEDLVKLWLEGLPNSVRLKLWPIAIGNQLRVTPALIDALKIRANRLSRDDSACSSRQPSREFDGYPSSSETFKYLISLEKDLKSEHTTKLAGKDMQPDLLERAAELLKILYVTRPDVRYQEGSVQLALMILMTVETSQTVSAFLNLMHQCYFLDFFTFRWGYMRMRLDFFDKLLKERLPHLEEHLNLLHLTSDMYLIPWLLSGFSRVLPFKTVCRVWDGFVLLGEAHMFSCAFALLGFHEHSLMTQGFAGCIETLIERADEALFDEDRFFRLLNFHTVPTHRHAQWNATQLLAEEKQALYDLL